MTDVPVNELVLLNRYCRTDAARHHGYTCVRSIYAYKREALRLLHDRGELSLRKVALSATCRDCGGDGRYVDQYGHCHDHCWKCNSTGQVVLTFVESTLTSGDVMHTPAEKWHRGTGGMQTYLETNWRPNQTHDDMAPSVVAGCLRVVESWFWPCLDIDRRRKDWMATYELGFQYSLFVGHATDVCTSCGCVSARNCVVTKGALSAVLGYCDRCYRLLGWDGFWIPTEMTIQVPEIRLWLDSRRINQQIHDGIVGLKDKLRRDKQLAQCEIPF